VPQDTEKLEVLDLVDFGCVVAIAISVETVIQCPPSVGSCCSMLQNVVVYCTVLQCAAVSYSSPPCCSKL